VLRRKEIKPLLGCWWRRVPIPYLPPKGNERNSLKENTVGLALLLSPLLNTSLVQDLHNRRSTRTRNQTPHTSSSYDELPTQARTQSLVVTRTIEPAPSGLDRCRIRTGPSTSPLEYSHSNSESNDGARSMSDLNRSIYLTFIFIVVYPDFRDR
jgi:hypothetical protein